MPTSKQVSNRTKFTKEYKVREIQKNLTRKARLKKQYLKTLKEEGYEVPDKKPPTTSQANVKTLREERALQGRKKLDDKREIKKQRKRLQAEKAQEFRKLEIERIKRAKEMGQERERKKKKMTQRTRSGQPRMGPKIEEMLGKIKGDALYTE
ncbi:FYV7 (YLR068W) [Zygosaccharomyces parabailii]|nr:FYV7 (YLR068W) [Zygosaccharomyces parabailii]CDH09619.1 related to rRNA-processing protein FYV7 [Zygosaccharomyces bailii ISA1307]